MKVFNVMAVMYSLSKESVINAVSVRTLITVKPVRNVLDMSIRSSKLGKLEVLRKSCPLWSMIMYLPQHLTKTFSPNQLLTRTLRNLKLPQTKVAGITRVSGLKEVEVAGKDVEEAVDVDQVVQAVVSWA